MNGTRSSAAQTFVAALLVLLLATGLATGVSGLIARAKRADTEARAEGRGSAGDQGAERDTAEGRGGVRAAASNPGPGVTEGAGNATALLDGTATAGIESTLEEEILLRRPAITVFAALRYALFRAGNDGVVVGRHGRLFTLEELEHHESDSAELEQRLQFVSAVARWLEVRRVALVVALLPAKARVQSEALRGRFQSLADHPRYAEATSAFAGQGVLVADLLQPLEQVKEAFLERDTHWTPDGAAAAARAVADAALRVELPDAPRAEFETIAGERVSVRGDLMSFVPVGPFAAPLGLTPQTVQLTETVQTSESALGLFETPSVPVTLVGTSYSADERWNFVGELRAALGMDVLNVAEEGLGPFVPLADYLQSEAFREVRPELIVWEIPERYLTLPSVEVPVFP